MDFHNLRVCSRHSGGIFFLIPVLIRLKFGQEIREIGPKWHKKKAGTPTMGGVIFIIASLLTTLIFRP
ncbi:MAG: hypothetical protein L6V93_15885 [Clostridiales bacterium]|nr:MAG: hypothetical protein L6V93_15885 [Clostridiales bacterium]